MTTINAAQAKDKLPSLLQAAERGEVVTITRYGRPVAELRGLPAASAGTPPLDNKASMTRLRAERAGLNLRDSTAVAELHALAPPEGSTEWLVTEIAKLNLPRAPIDAGAFVRAMRDETGDW